MDVLQRWHQEPSPKTRQPTSNTSNTATKQLRRDHLELGTARMFRGSFLGLGTPYTPCDNQNAGYSGGHWWELQLCSVGLDALDLGAGNWNTPRGCRISLGGTPRLSKDSPREFSEGGLQGYSIKNQLHQDQGNMTVLRCRQHPSFELNSPEAFSTHAVYEKHEKIKDCLAHVVNSMQSMRFHKGELHLRCLQRPCF